MVVTPLIAVMVDRVAPQHRGLVSSICSIGNVIGQYGGPVIGGLFLSSTRPALINVGYNVLAVIMLFSGPISIVIMREKSSLAMAIKPFSLNALAQMFRFPHHGAYNFYLTLFGRMLINITVTAFGAYQVFFLTSGMGESSSVAGQYISWMGLATMGSAIMFSSISGPLSDKLGTRKLPVALAALLIAGGGL